MKRWKRIPHQVMRRSIPASCEGEVELQFTDDGELRIVGHGAVIELRVPAREMVSLRHQLEVVKARFRQLKQEFEVVP